MRLTTAVVMVALVGCAGNQSAFPMPPVFSPVEDAPITVGHPGYVAPEPERSPHTRVLPETPDTRRGPGIWAGDSGANVPFVVPLFGVPLALPDDATPDDANRVFACASSMREAASAYLVAIAALPFNVRACMAADLNAHCALGAVIVYEKHRAAGKYFDANEIARQKRLADVADADRRKKCPTPLPKDILPMMQEIKTRWTNAWDDMPSQ